jgi:hypothetical protein
VDIKIPLDPYTGEPWNARAAAAEGAALLDRLPWPGWREQVDLSRLDMGEGQYRDEPECKACVGAQLAYQRVVAAHPGQPGYWDGSYTEFVAQVLPWLYVPGGAPGASLDFTVHYGFRTPTDDEGGGEDGLYAELTAAWQALLRGEG